MSYLRFVIYTLTISCWLINQAIYLDPLGWIRITTFILVKKLLFALSILRPKEDNIVRQAFIEKVENFNQEQKSLYSNVNCSPTYDILNSAERFGMYNLMYSICTRKGQI